MKGDVHQTTRSPVGARRGGSPPCLGACRACRRGVHHCSWWPTGACRSGSTAATGGPLGLEGGGSTATPRSSQGGLTTVPRGPVRLKGKCPQLCPGSRWGSPVEIHHCARGLLGFEEGGPLLCPGARRGSHGGSAAAPQVPARAHRWGPAAMPRGLPGLKKGGIYWCAQCPAGTYVGGVHCSYWAQAGACRGVNRCARCPAGARSGDPPAHPVTDWGSRGGVHCRALGPTAGLQHVSTTTLEHARD